MKYFLVGMIKIYQLTPLHSHSLCRFQPTCSTYMIEAIRKYGTFKGVGLGIKRILRCHPKGKSGYDPVPLKKEKKHEKN